MGDVTGPISSLPGSLHDVPDGTRCDYHPHRKAVSRIQGETDSFGCEMIDCCQECLNEIRAEFDSAEARTGECEWCKGQASDLRDTRDYEEGLRGRVYRVCGACRQRVEDEARAELDSYGGWE